MLTDGKALVSAAWSPHGSSIGAIITHQGERAGFAISSRFWYTGAVAIAQSRTLDCLRFFVVVRSRNALHSSAVAIPCTRLLVLQFFISNRSLAQTRSLITQQMDEEDAVLETRLHQMQAI